MFKAAFTKVLLKILYKTSHKMESLMMPVVWIRRKIPITLMFLFLSSKIFQRQPSEPQLLSTVDLHMGFHLNALTYTKYLLV